MFKNMPYNYCFLSFILHYTIKLKDTIKKMFTGMCSDYTGNYLRH